LSGGLCALLVQVRGADIEVGPLGGELAMAVPCGRDTRGDARVLGSEVLEVARRAAGGQESEFADQLFVAVAGEFKLPHVLGAGCAGRLPAVDLSGGGVAIIERRRWR